MMLANKAIRMAPLLNQQSKRGLATLKDVRKSLISSENLQRFTHLVRVELRPPTPGEIPKAIRDGTRLFTKGNWKNITVREAWLNALVTTEVICWFFVGECIGKGSLIGYQV